MLKRKSCEEDAGRWKAPQSIKYRPIEQWLANPVAAVRMESISGTKSIMEEVNGAGLEALYTLHRAALLRFLTSRTGDRADAEEIIQDLWIRIQSTSVGPIGNGRAYLYRMAQNLVLDRLRGQKRRAERDRGWSDANYGVHAAGAEAIDDRPNAEEEMAAREETARIASALGTLPEGAARVFRLHKIDGLSHGEVAEQLGIVRRQHQWPRFEVVN